MTKFGLFLGATLIGASAMYFFDPERGKTRRALVRDKAIALGNDLQDDLDVMVRDFQNRSKGAFYEVKGNLNKDGISKVVEHFRGQKENQPETSASDARIQPAVCLMIGSAGAIMTLMGIIRRGLFGGIMATTGTALIARSFYEVEHRFDRQPECQDKETGKRQTPTRNKRKQPQATMQ